MQATEKEKQVINTAMRWKLCSLFTIGTLIVFIAATYIKMPEYRPITVSYRTVVANTAYQPSVSRATLISVSQSVSCALTLTGGASGTYSLQVCSTSGGTYTTIAQGATGSTGTVVIGIATNAIGGSPVVGVVPAGYFYKVIFATVSGTPTNSITTNAQETNL